MTHQTKIFYTNGTYLKDKNHSLHTNFISRLQREPVVEDLSWEVDKKMRASVKNGGSSSAGNKDLSRIEPSFFYTEERGTSSVI